MLGQNVRIVWSDFAVFIGETDGHDAHEKRLDDNGRRPSTARRRKPGTALGGQLAGQLNRVPEPVVDSSAQTLRHLRVPAECGHSVRRVDLFVSKNRLNELA